MRTEWFPAVGVATLVALVAACLWHVASNGVLAFAGAAVVVLLAWLVRQQRAVEKLRRLATPYDVFGVPVHVVPGDVACTAGPFLPTIFLGAQVLSALEERELRAVVLHERGHSRRLDPLRAEMTSILRAATPPRLRRPDVESHAEALREIGADRSALRHGATRSALAASLLKVPVTAATGAVGFASTSELRVQALLGGTVPPANRRRWPVVLAGVVAGTALCLLGLEATLLASVTSCCA